MDNENVKTERKEFRNYKILQLNFGLLTH